MALPNNPSRDGIWDELTASNYRNGGANNNSLKDMDAYVFGGDGSNYSRDGFGGYGVPSVGNSLSTSVNGTDVTFTFDLTGTGGFPTTIVVEFWTDTSSEHPSTVFSDEQTYSTTGTKNMTVDMGSANQDFEARILCYNKFNNSGNHTNSSWPNTEPYYDYTEVTSFQTGDLYPPVEIDSCNYVSASSMTAEWDYGDEPSNFQVQTRTPLGTSTSWSTATVKNSTNWGSSNNPKTVEVDPPQVHSAGDPIEIRVRAYVSSTTNSDWGNCQDIM